MTDNPHDFALYLNDNLSEVDLDEALAALSPQRREQAMKFKRPQGRLLSAVAYGLLCRGLRERYAVSELPELGYAEGGKPFIVGHEHIHFNMSQEDLTSLLTNYMNGAELTYDSNLTKIGYASKDSPESISIYPKDFAAKQSVLDAIDRYNDEQTAQGKNDATIQYSDIAGRIASGCG